MTDPQQVLIGNLTEAIRQVQRYSVVGLWTGISALALTPGSGMIADPPASATPPGSPIPFDASTDRLLLLGTCFVVGALASYAAENANRIAARVAAFPELLEAVQLYPGVPTSPYPLVRFGAAALPALFGIAAVLVNAFQTASADRGAVWIACVVIASPYLTLGVEMRERLGGNNGIG